MLKTQNIILKSSGSQIRSYIYIADCASGILTVLLNGEKGEAYNVANKGSILTIAEFAEEVAKISGRKVVFENLGGVSKIEQTPITRAVLNSSKIEALGWGAKYPINIGIENIFKILGE